MQSSGRLEIIREGNALDISDLAHYAVEEIDGFGMPPLHRISERGPLQHGESDRGYRLDPRLIQLVLKLRTNGWESTYARRQELLSFVSPMTPMSLRFTQPDGTVRQIEGHCVDGPDFATKDRLRDRFQRAALRILCPDPAWYDPERQSVRATGGGGGEGFSFPMAVPWTFGGDVIDTEVVIEYAGNWLDYPEIVIVGPIENARIEHMETGEVLEFGGPLIENGDTYTLDLRYGRKTVVDGAGANKIAELTAESDLAAWHLRPGSNTIRFSGINASANTSITLRWYNRFLGV